VLFLCSKLTDHFSKGGIAGKPCGAGRRIIMIGIGSEDGFLAPTKCFIGQKNNKNQDYHTEMNGDHFKEWFAEVLAEIPEKSVVVVDQASYHKMVTEETKNPTTAWRKAAVIDWLIARNVPVPRPYDEFRHMNLPGLRVLAKQHRVQAKYVIEDMAEQSGKDVKVLWLPVAHCELNAIELVWASVKRKLL